MKKFFAAMLCIVMALSVSACHMIFTDEEKDRAQVVATVFGEEITKGEVIDLYDSYFGGYGLDDENKAYYMKYVLDMLIESKVQEVKVNQMGIELTEEELKEIDDEIAQSLEAVEEQIRETVKKEAEEDSSIDVEAEVKKQMDELKESAGINSGEYRESMITSAKINKVKQDTIKDITVTEDEVKAEYDKLLEEQKASLDENPGASVSGTQVYNAPGRRYVKNLLIMIPEETRTEIAAIEDESEAEARQNEELAKIKAKADEVLAKVKAGEDFDSLIAAYGEDTGMTTGDAKKQGYLIYEGISNYDKTFVSAAMALKNVGDTTDLVATQFGYHIIKYASDAPSGAIAYETVKEKIQSSLLSTKQSEAWTEVTDGWYEEANVQKYEDRL